jgi:hypothetical protein
MSRFVMIAASVALLGAMPAHAAPKAVAKAPFPMAADGTTNIADCAKSDVKFRNECISKSRPVSGKQLYAEAAAYNAMMAKKQVVDAGKSKAAKAVEAAKAAKAAAATAAKDKVAKVKAAVPAAVVGAPKGFKIGKDGTTNVADCAKAAPAVRNECISRARPLSGKELAKFIKSRAAATPVAPVKAAAKPAAAVKTVVAAKPVVAPVRGKGFVIAKDGTTNIGDCAKANPEFRNECISRARPVPGKVIYASMKTKA